MLESHSDKNPLALINRGILYEFGLRVAKANEQKAFEMYCRAAKWPISKTQWTLGLCYLNGRGVRSDKQQAMEWFEKAAANGDANAKSQVQMMKGKQTYCFSWENQTVYLCLRFDCLCVK